jgi:hypothetical protein
LALIFIFLSSLFISSFCIRLFLFLFQSSSSTSGLNILIVLSILLVCSGCA